MALILIISVILFLLFGLLTYVYGDKLGEWLINAINYLFEQK